MANDESQQFKSEFQQEVSSAASGPHEESPVGSTPSSTTATSAESGGASDRAELISRARAFLTSPQIRHEDVSSKRRFLEDKGLTEYEIAALLQEVPPQIPVVPPRTYPQPPPSNLPNLLIGLLRIFTWLATGSAGLILLYYRFLLPRLTQSSQARRSLKLHQKDILSKLTTSLTALKDSQTEAYASLPRQGPLEESQEFLGFHSLDDLRNVEDSNGKKGEELTLLRCAIEEISARGQEPSTEAIFDLLQNKMPSTFLEDVEGTQNRLWQMLSTQPSFHRMETAHTLVWSHEALPPSPTLAPLSSLQDLRASLPRDRPTGNRFQYTLQALSDFTGYITTQTYALPNLTSFRSGLGMSGSPLGPQEEEIRKEIRALKGLALNRRSFMPPIPRPMSAHATSAAPSS